MSEERPTGLLPELFAPYMTRERRRICELAPRDVFNLVRHPEETYVCVERGDVLRLDGMEHHYHALSRIEVIGQFDTAQMAVVETKRHPWKPEPMPEPPGSKQRRPYRTQAMRDTEEIDKYKEAVAVLTSELATLKIEADTLRKILYHLANTLPKEK